MPEGKHNNIPNIFEENLTFILIWNTLKCPVQYHLYRNEALIYATWRLLLQTTRPMWHFHSLACPTSFWARNSTLAITIFGRRAISPPKSSGAICIQWSRACLWKNDRKSAELTCRASSHCRDPHPLTVLQQLVFNGCQGRHNEHCGAYLRNG